MNDEVFNVTVESNDQYEALYETTFTEESKAVKQAEKWANEHKDKLVFVKFSRASDGQWGYINRDGANVTGQSWTK